MLRDAHQRFHAEVGTVIGLVVAKRLEEARTSVLSGPMHGLSTETIALIEGLRPRSRRPVATASAGEGFLRWDAKYATGHAGIDAQHQELFRRTGELHAAMQEGRGRASILELIGFLAEYTTRHFSAEEAVMRTAGYPGIADHQQLHRELLGQVADLHKRATANEPLRTMEVSEFLASWLKHHILEIDHQYIPYVRRMPASAATM